MTTGTPLLEVQNIAKAFPGVLALDGVSCRIETGESVAIVGENGAGKSTLMKILAGVYQPDSGTIKLDGQTIQFPTPSDAMACGIRLIHQELSLAENLSVVDNLYLGRELVKGGFLRWLDRAQMLQNGRAVLKRVGLSADYADAIVGTLAPGQKQLVEIARALLFDARLIIMDEPTSSLTQTETNTLYEVIDTLLSQRVSIVFISHRLAEVRRCCQRAIVLRDGKLSGELTRDEMTHDNLVKYMVGRDLKHYFPRNARTTAGKTVLKIEHIRYANGPNSGASFVLNAGEVLGTSGLVGAGRTELAETIFGIRKRVAGELQLFGQPVSISSPRDAIAAGIYLVPEDRKLHGLMVDASVGFNLSLPNLGTVANRSWISSTLESTLHTDTISKLRVKTPTANQTVGVLSGGNQQKVVLGKWLARSPKVLILDEPTRGVDVGAKAEIYSLIDEIAGQGVAVWMITSDLEELLGMSDRVMVMHEGRIAGTLLRDDCDEEIIMRLATGGSR